MSIEAGARAGMIAPDATTFAYLKGRRFSPGTPKNPGNNPGAPSLASETWVFICLESLYAAMRILLHEKRLPAPSA
jgi:hypothetical protein